MVRKHSKLEGACESVCLSPPSEF